MAICPYNIKQIKYVKQYSNDLASEESGVVKSNQEVYVEDRVMMECFGDKCGAYYGGKCNYYTHQGETNS